MIYVTNYFSLNHKELILEQEKQLMKETIDEMDFLKNIVEDYRENKRRDNESVVHNKV